MGLTCCGLDLSLVFWRRRTRVEKEWAQLWLVASRKHLARLQSSERVHDLLAQLHGQVSRGELNVDQAAESILKL